MGECLRLKIKSMFIFSPTTTSTQPNWTKSEVWFDLKMTLQHHHEPPSHNETFFVIVVSSSFLRLIKINNKLGLSCVKLS